LSSPEITISLREASELKNRSTIERKTEALRKDAED